MARKAAKLTKGQVRMVQSVHRFSTSDEHGEGMTWTRFREHSSAPGYSKPLMPQEYVSSEKATAESLVKRGLLRKDKHPETGGVRYAVNYEHPAITEDARLHKLPTKAAQPAVLKDPRYRSRSGQDDCVLGATSGRSGGHAGYGV